MTAQRQLEKAIRLTTNAQKKREFEERVRLLVEKKLELEVLNDGTHIRFTWKGVTYDYWPTKDKYFHHGMERSKVGLKELLET